MGPTSITAPDYGKPDHARLLATRIERYWHDLGFVDARAWAVQCGRGDEGTWIVQSNLINGTPPGRRV